ncbi:hypothetical protein AFE_1169 [Acidithiobacillus ferrooxidans ATCC 23270]|uniref:Uncharacterized protein n=1 Tax=Acidithiobacillus ferrooxidans (strain ATCC 23270 / DSM 14882 / CIP 104768 / NCIMB 8455) TaxID=243159 RepID=B7J8A3_ACIF2|nr:hypothetical protein AFE_1169 [Acidithiobacillus ferrooxidans ATCC 23270]
MVRKPCRSFARTRRTASASGNRIIAKGTPDFGRKVRDTGHGCREDGEPPIRVKLRVRCYAWDDFTPCRAQKSWKRYRDHQWRG